jgi:hypothetical protein
MSGLNVGSFDSAARVAAVAAGSLWTLVKTLCKRMVWTLVRRPWTLVREKTQSINESARLSRGLR